MKELTNTITQDDCLDLIKQIPDSSIDSIITDPPYLYLKNQKLDRPFDEQQFFSEAKRVLKRNGFTVLFGRGTSFYRWNCMLANLGFTFKEEIIWNKVYNSSPLMAMSRVHETISIHTKGKGLINKVKIPYLEMKGHDIDAIVVDIKKIKTALNNTKSLNAILNFLENNRIDTANIENVNNTTISSPITLANRSASVIYAMRDGMNEKSIIRTDYVTQKQGYGVTLASDTKEGDRNVNVMQAIDYGMNEKSIIKQPRDHYGTIHPTQKPVRLLERLLALVSKEGDLILDPFSGSGSTALACRNTGRNFIAFEIDREYYEAGMERLQKVLTTPKQLKCF
ncbi:MAG: site-specific DNA-methyltransferase [Prevotellaceae bacterium]|jgi:site-specific DNA-methyltransferase (adenine-specific)|nr:site-specific DNA-methyltransferase [Prevotellaceae bacterium]